MKEIHTRRTSEFLVGLGVLCVGCFVSAAYYFNELSDEHLQQKAIREAEQLAIQLLKSADVQFKASPRSPAATDSPRIMTDKVTHLGEFGVNGKLSKDPWGRSYRYQLILSELGTAKALVVWSDGSNLKPETNEESFKLTYHLKSSEKIFNGDDIGYIKPLFTN